MEQASKAVRWRVVGCEALSRTSPRAINACIQVAVVIVIAAALCATVV